MCVRSGNFAFKLTCLITYEVYFKPYLTVHRVAYRLTTLRASADYLQNDNFMKIIKMDCFVKSWRVGAGE